MSRWGFLKSEATTPAEDRLPPIEAPAAALGTGDDWRVRTILKDPEHVTDLKNYGFRVAGASDAKPEVLKTYIGWLYHNKLTVDDVRASGEHERVSELNDQIARVRGGLTNAKHRHDELESKLADERVQISAKHADLAAVRAGDGTVVESHGLSDRVSFFISAAILAVLTVYLFLFYVSAIYNAFLFDPAKAAEEGLRTGQQLSVTIFNGAAFQKAWASGFMTFVFVGSAPSIVLGLGFLIHHFQRAKRQVVAAMIVLVTLLFDILIAYEIVYQIHQIRVLTGEVTGEYTLKTMVQSAEFWIIVMAGFVVYLIWGFILQAVLEGIEKFHPARVAERRLREAIKVLEASCARIAEDLRGAKAEVVRLEAEINVLEQQRSPRELRNNAFGRHVEEFMQGWLTFIAQAFPTEVYEKQAEAQTVRTATVSMLTGKV
jgi:hypothetical protein